MVKKIDRLKTNFKVQSIIESFYSSGQVAWSKCGTYLFSNAGNKINCVDFSSGQISFLIGDNDKDSEVTALCLSPCDEFLLVAYQNTLITQFTLNLAKKCATVERTWKSGHRGPVTVFAFTDDTHFLATGSADSTVKVWDLKAQYCIQTLKECSGCITCVQFSPSYFLSASSTVEIKQFLFYGDDMGRLFVRQLSSDKNDQQILNVSHHTSPISSVIFDQKSVYTCARDSTIVKLSGEKNFALDKIIPTFESLESMIFSATDIYHGLDDDTRKSKKRGTQTEDVILLSGGESGCLKLWSVNKGTCIKTLKVVEGGPIVQVLHCESLRMYLTINYDQSFSIVSVDSFEIEGKLIGRNDEIYDLAFCGSDDKYAIVATNSSDVRLYDLSTSKCRLLSGAHSDAVLGLDVANWDKNVIVTCSKDNTLAVWRIHDDGKTSKICCQYLATGHAGSVSAARLSRLKPTAKSAAFIVSVSDDRTLKIWSLPLESDSLCHSNHLNKDDITRLTAPCTVVAHDKDIPALCVAPNDRFVASGSMDKTVKIWAVELSKSLLSLNLVATLKDHKRGVFDVKFSPVDQVIVTASGDFTLKIFALEDFTCIKTFEGHQAAVLQVCFVSNGAQLVSSDSMGLLKLWTIKTSECTKTLDGHEEKIYALNVDSTGDKLLTGGSDAKILCWKDETENERALEESQKQEKIKNEQTLANLIEGGKFTEALKLSLRLSRPHDSYKIIERILQQQDDDAVLKKVLKSVPEDQTALLLSYVAEWNSNSRHYLIAQKVLKNILKLFTPDQLLKIPNIEQIVETLLPYSSRHFERLSRTKQQTFFVDYTWNCMRMCENLSFSEKGLIKHEM